MLPLDTLLPLRCLAVTLRFTADSRPEFFHQPALGAFLRHLAGSPADFERLIRFDTPESGRIHYRPGDHYRFNLIALAGGDAILGQLLAGLAALPGSSPKRGGPLPFRDNLQLAALHDAFSAEPVRRPAELSVYDAAALEREAVYWQQQPRWSWHSLSPARLLKHKTVRGAAKGEARYCRNLADLDGALLLARLYDSLAELLRRQDAVLPPRPEPPALAVESGHLFWLDAAYTDAAGQSHTMGGAAGQLQLAPAQALPLEWAKLLALGQYTGIGQRGTFGWGRYRLAAPDGNLRYRRCLPAASLLQPAQDPHNLAEAHRHIQDNLRRPAPADGDADWDELQAAQSLAPAEPEAADIPLERLQRALDSALGGGYRPPPLQGYVLAKPDGGVRPLAVPTFFDRVLQRAVAQVLSPALEHIQYRHSYGFRPGRSRMQARDAIQSAYREGFRWVFESDVDDFFDSVDWQRLEIRLRALFGDDPLVPALIAWMAAPVDYQGIAIERRAGLPQGSPLSPALANLMLDDFDSDMETLGFRLIRFADDFVVLCKDREQAEQAEQAARASLAEHGLQLNDGKTRIAATEQGFRYLGYLFVNDTAVDVAGREREPGEDAGVPPRSWLARVAERPAAPLDESGPVPEPADGRPHPLALGRLGEEGLLLCITGDSTCLSSQAKRLRVSRGKDTLHELPWDTLQAVLLFGRHHLTAPAVQAALEHGVPIHFASSLGTYQGVLDNGRPQGPGHALWLKQASLFADALQTLPLAKAVVAARLAHQRETLRLRGLHEAAERLKQRARDMETAAGIEALHGFEGSAGRDYLQALATLLPEAFGFSGRNRQPPRDPFNALLSLGYTLLYGYADTLLRADGLLPWLGFYHQPHGSHACLASDLMEPFRHLVERTALSLIQRRELAVKDFYLTADSACRLHNDARRRYLAALLDKLNTPLAALDGGAAYTPIQHLHRQNLSLMAWLYQGTPFRPWRTR